MSEQEFNRISLLDEKEFRRMPPQFQEEYLRQRQANFAERCTMDSVEGVRCADTGESMTDYLTRRRREKADAAAKSSASPPV